MNRQECKKIDIIETGETIIEGVFDSKKVWKTLLAVSAVMMIFATVSMWKTNTPLCILFCTAAFVLSVVGTLVSLRDSRVKFEVTNKCIYRKTLFGRHTYLPLNSIRAVDMMCPGSISVRTAVGTFRCHLLKNNYEVFCVIKTLLDERQMNK